MHLLILTRYSRLGASSRLRTLQYLTWFNQAGLTYTLAPLISDELLQRSYQKGNYRFTNLLSTYWKRIGALLKRRNVDLIWIEKEALPWMPAWFERLLLIGTPYVLDYDDAIFHNYDQHPSPWVRYLLGRRIDNLMLGSRLVTTGNAYLAQRARDSGAKKVSIIPTVIDLDRYVPKRDTIESNEIIRIVWIGSPHTIKYLQALHKPLVKLSQRFTFKLRLISSSTLDLPGVNVEFVEWTEATEVASLKACDIGIMPLADSPWESGKCGYKLIQYMACNLPVVASPIGVNTEIIHNNENGYLAKTDQEWVDALAKLLNNKSLCQRMGEMGRKRVEAEYCIQQVAPKLIKLLNEAKTD